MNNMKLSAHVIQTFLEFGVNEFCLCAGARNSPLIKTFENNPQIKVYHFFEERSAAFFALGRIQRTQKPVAVVTTSGTAVAELLPAVVEGYYSGLPLVLLTADRPKSYRGSGAPQTIEHMGIFSHYVKRSLDLDVTDFKFPLNDCLEKGPLHVNVCFDEPLLDQTGLQLDPILESTKENFNSLILSRQSLSKEQNILAIEKFCQDFKPMVILSGIDKIDHAVVMSFVEKLKCPLFVEGTSGLRNHPRLKSHSLLVPEKMAKYLFTHEFCNAIIRIGGIPTTRFWRDLEFDLKSVPVLSISNNSFTGLSRKSQILSPIKFLSECSLSSITTDLANVWDRDQSLHKKLSELFRFYPLAEPSLISKLSQQLYGDRVYLGNSMPIREWDLAVEKELHFPEVVANRGANGIDGQISTFLGWARGEVCNWALVGDLTALYDLPSLWISKQIEAENICVLVINNGGGMIFNKLFKSEYFLNRHDLNFSSWAEMWNWNYEKWHDIPLKKLKSGRTIIELVPDEKQTRLFWEEWDRE